MYTKHFRVYPLEGHRLKESFNESYSLNFSKPDKIRVINVFNSDITGTNDYTDIVITCDDPESCDREMEGQFTDGIFENCNCSHYVVINEFEDDNKQTEEQEEPEELSYLEQMILNNDDINEKTCFTIYYYKGGCQKGNYFEDNILKIINDHRIIRDDIIYYTYHPCDNTMIIGIRKEVRS